MKEKISGIYCIENLRNNKKYIGYSADIDTRWSNHISDLRDNDHCNLYLQHSWNKYGEKIFKFWIIDRYPPIKEILCLMEIYFIAYYNSFIDDGEGYNLTRGGEMTIFSEESINKISLSHFGIRPSDESREKMSIAKKGKHFSKEHRENIGNSIRGEKNGNFGKFGEKNPLYKRKKTDEEKEHVRQLRLERDNFPKVGNGSRLGTKLKTSEFFGLEKRIYPSGNINWSIRININGKRVGLGTYSDKIMAAKIYDKYVVEHNLPKHSLNFPEDYPNRKVVK